MPTKPKRKPSYKKVAEEFKNGISTYRLAFIYKLSWEAVEAMIRRALKEQQ